MSEENKAREAAIHFELMKALQHVFDTYGIRVNNISVEWVATNTFGKTVCRATEITLNTTSYPTLY